MTQHSPTNQAEAITPAVAYFEAVTPAALDSCSILAANRDACLAAMAHVGAQFASVEYAGSGDSGEGVDVYAYADVDRRQLVAMPLLKPDVGMLVGLQRWETGHPFGRLVVHGAVHLDDTAIRQVRDLVLEADPASVPGVYGVWIESGLPPELFEGSLAPDADLRMERRLMARRLALVKEELQALPAMACDVFLRMRLRGLLTGWRRDLERGLAAAGLASKTVVSGSPAAR